MRRILFTTFTIIVFLSCNEKQNESADKIYFNAKIWTGDSANAWADAIAIKGNEIVYVGKDYQSFKGANTEMIDLGGKLMTPGFIDNHTHFLSGGYNLSAVDLRKAKTHRNLFLFSKNFVRNKMMIVGY